MQIYVPVLLFNKSMMTNLSIALVKSSSSSMVPYASYVSSMIDNIAITFVVIFLAREYWGSKYAVKIQKQHSTIL